MSKSNKKQFNANDEVLHARYGLGVVELPKDETVLVRFEHGFEECEINSLHKQVNLWKAMDQNELHSPMEVIAKCQAISILSVNDTWGAFSRSRIALLPHQLWVCHQVLRRWPIRYLVADDVGLGKTIEAGLILWPLLSKGLVRRLLILCPASLVEQWQFRLREMFDIRLTRYTTDADSKKGDFWNTHTQVVASLPTLRADKNGRHERMLEAEPWDLVIVDEAHHLNADERGGPTLGYALLESLLKNKKVDSCIFFTGTPHRGKSFGFWSLMKLLRPDLFDPKKSEFDQLELLRDVLIRNNKSLVTDMQGIKLFQPVTVYPEKYSYTAEESEFYGLLTDFIAGGKAYATSLSAKERGQVMLVLISMQKLASSSVAAIRKALKGRLDRLRVSRKEMQTTIKLSANESNALRAATDESFSLSDEQQDVDVDVAKATLLLMEEEIPHLKSLVSAAEAVGKETKIDKILEVLEGRYKDRRVLFFTEYKATQSSLMQALMAKYGEKCVTFINGDERLDDLLLPDGNTVVRSVNREDAADSFNQGKVRFLISTEAGGEGIDLQERCYSLIHVDLPWNPMRLHQRVGRLNRYGQKKPVDVITLRNPDTVESRIWDKLNTKLEQIMTALGSAMDDPEDLLQLVLGMTSSNNFTELFTEGQFVKKDRLDNWFDTKSTTLGGQPVIDTVKSLVGHANRFDLRGLKDIPNVDLPDLSPFFKNMLKINHRRFADEDGALSFKTPEKWLDEPGVRGKYEGLVFDRDVQGKSAAEKVIGVGHKAFDKAVKNATELPVSLAYVKDLSKSLFVFYAYDRVTDQLGHMRQAVIGVEVDFNGNQQSTKLIKDWEVLKYLNNCNIKDKTSDQQNIDLEIISAKYKEVESLIDVNKEKLGLPFRIPEFRPIALLMVV